MIGLDTNVLVRYLAQDDAKQSALATRLIEGALTVERPGFVSLIAVVEVVWVLESCYGSSRSQIADVLDRVLRVKQLRVQDAELVARSTRRFRAGKADFADELLVCLADAHGCSHSVTFDKVAASIVGMRPLEAGAIS